MNAADAALHARGEARFVDDLPNPEGLLHAAVAVSTVAHGRIERLELEEAARLPGVAAVLSAEEVPGENQIGTIVPDEPLLADGEVHFVGQPLALVVADTPEAARAGAQAVHARVEELPAVFDARQAARQGLLIGASRTLELGQVEEAWDECDLVVEGRVDTGAQEHLYMETQAALALPGEDGSLKLLSATQSPTGVQRMTARVLGVPMHRVEVEVPRLGGGFGGKEDQATPWAALAALAAFRLRRPVKLVLRRREDVPLTGKRHPYSADFRLGLSREGRLVAYQVTFYQDAGAHADLSPSILERTLFHATGSYFIPHVRATGLSCRTNLPPNTAFRGFGAPQAMFVLEAAIARGADALGMSPLEVQQRNLLQEGDLFPYGMEARDSRARRCFGVARERFDLPRWRERIATYNAAHALSKKGLAAVPVCFGISFTNTVLNQGGALVHVYTDGSVSVSTGAVEMGQGVRRKIAEAVARTLGVDRERVRVESTTTLTVANTSPTAASTGADLNGGAARLACQAILERLREAAAGELGCEAGSVEVRSGQVYCGGEPASLSWEALVAAAYRRRLGLSAQAHYATPGIHFDRSREKGEPFAYHVYGTALVEATLDCLRGTYRIEAVRVVHDLGSSLEPAVDLGQAEGGIVQGLGWLTVEEVARSQRGETLTRDLSTYKVPDLYFAPAEMEILFLEDAPGAGGLLRSKAIGEPPFMYGIAGYFALAAAMKAYRPELEVPLSAPLTPERVLLALAGAEAEAGREEAGPSRRPGRQPAPAQQRSAAAASTRRGEGGRR